MFNPFANKPVPPKPEGPKLYSEEEIRAALKVLIAASKTNQITTKVSYYAIHATLGQQSMAAAGQQTATLGAAGFMGMSYPSSKTLEEILRSPPEFEIKSKEKMKEERRAQNEWELKRYAEQQSELENKISRIRAEMEE